MSVSIQGTTVSVSIQGTTVSVSILGTTVSVSILGTTMSVSILAPQCFLNFSVHSGLFKLLPVRQSAYRRFHSTETAVAIVHNDIVRETDVGQITALVLLDLSAAFDTVDHGVLLDVLSSRFGVMDRVFEWFQSYLKGRTQVFCTSSDYSEVTSIACSVPQGSVARPLLFIAYTEDLEKTISSFTFNHHVFADDMQLLAHMSLNDVQYVRSGLERCILAIQNWCSSRRLQLNPDKTEVIWFGS